MHPRIQNYLRAVAPLGRDQERIGPFLATYTPHTDNPYLNYAIPDDGAEPTDDEVGELIAAYRHRKRKPRLEFVPDAAPAVEDALVRAGFVSEGRLPLMVTDSDSVREGTEPHGVSLLVPATDDELYGMAVVRAEAYDEPGLPGRDVVQGMRLSLAAGSLAVIARDDATGQVVGAGSCSPVRDGLTEVAGIGVAATHRRRGIGGALAARLAIEAIRAGAVAPWLMAAHDSEQRTYERVGFGVIGEVLHISH